MYGTLKPKWDRTFEFLIYDVFSLVKITVNDEDQGQSFDFLGRVSLSLLDLPQGDTWSVLPHDVLLVFLISSFGCTLRACISTSHDSARTRTRTHTHTHTHHINTHTHTHTQIHTHTTYIHTHTHTHTQSHKVCA
jgi:hypothetical protein